MPSKKQTKPVEDPSTIVKNKLTRKQIVALLRKEDKSTWLVYRDLEDGGAVVITATGQKYTYTAGMIEEFKRDTRHVEHGT